VVAKLLNPLVRGWQNYYCYFIKGDLNDLWRFVKRQLVKWCKCPPDRTGREQADEFAQEPQMAEYIVQITTRFVCPLECMPGLLIANIILKSRMNREVHSLSRT